MSANVGLSTPRGSGTSGYVQRNLSHLKPRENFKPYDKDLEAMNTDSASPTRRSSRTIARERLRWRSLTCAISSKTKGTYLPFPFHKRCVLFFSLSFYTCWLVYFPALTKKTSKRLCFLYRMSAEDSTVSDKERSAGGEARDVLF